MTSLVLVPYSAHYIRIQAESKRFGDIPHGQAVLGDMAKSIYLYTERVVTTKVGLDTDHVITMLQPFLGELILHIVRIEHSFSTRYQIPELSILIVIGTLGQVSRLERLRPPADNSCPYGEVFLTALPTE